MKYNYQINVENTVKEKFEFLDLKLVDNTEIYQLKFDLGMIKLNEVEFIKIDEWIAINHLNDDDASDFKENVEECLEDWIYKQVYYEDCEISTDKYDISNEQWFILKKGNKFYAISLDYWDIIDLKVKKLKD